MTFQFYRFCQSWLITLLSIVYTAFAVFTAAHGFSWWLSIIIGIAGFLTIFIPGMNIIHPFVFILFMVLAVCFSLSNITIHFYILLFVLVLYISRTWWMIRFSMKNPETSRDFDIALRNGYKRGPRL